MKTKPLWHDRAEEPVFVDEYAQYDGKQAYNRIAFLVAAPVEPDSGRNATFIESLRIYKEDTWRYGSWKVRREELGIVKWCYFEALVSDDAQIPDKDAPCCGNCAYWKKLKHDGFGNCEEWCMPRTSENWCRQYKRREEPK